MAESSIWWTTGATGDGASAYTQAQCILWLHKTFCGADNEGVNKDIDNELAGTGVTTPVAINTGEAYVRGFPYFNTVSVDVAVPTPSSNTRIDRIVLRAGWAAQTVRITRIAGTEGSGTPPALVQTDGTTWDIPLYQASITTGGVITLTDEREFLHPNIAVNTDMIDDAVLDSQHYMAESIDLLHMSANSVDSDQYVDGSIDLVHLSADSVDDTKAGNRIPQFYRRQGGSATDWHTAGTTTRTPSMVRMQAGAVVTDGNGDITVTFPVAFSAVPLVLASIGSNTVGVGVHQVSATSTQVVFKTFQTADSNDYGAATVNWLAIGPE